MNKRNMLLKTVALSCIFIAPYVSAIELPEQNPSQVQPIFKDRAKAANDYRTTNSDDSVTSGSSSSKASIDDTATQKSKISSTFNDTIIQTVLTETSNTNCTPNNTGITRYIGSQLQYCNGTSWINATLDNGPSSTTITTSVINAISSIRCSSPYGYVGQTYLVRRNTGRYYSDTYYTCTMTGQWAFSQQFVTDTGGR